MENPNLEANVNENEKGNALLMALVNKALTKLEDEDIFEVYYDATNLEEQVKNSVNMTRENGVPLLDPSNENEVAAFNGLLRKMLKEELSGSEWLTEKEGRFDAFLTYCENRVAELAKELNEKRG